jgi:CBS-domain-containing membrane protein
MNATFEPATTPLTLRAATARELMSPDPVSLPENATVREALALLTDRGFNAAPVIDAAGRPVGVLSRTDLLIHDRETSRQADFVPEYRDRIDLTGPDGERLGSGFEIENVDTTMVRDLMTPVVFSVAPTTTAAQVVQEMLALKVHQLYVVDDDCVLIGVISPLDVLRHLEA